MAEPKEINHTATRGGDNEALLDLDDDKDFLASWKSITMGESDKFDFDLTPVSKGKKKSFEFDQGDMDFNLDSDFGKVSSFNIDIPDLDISPPLKKDEPHEKTKGSSIRSSERNADRFAFAFDFDELGNFDLGPAVKHFTSNIQTEKDKEGFIRKSSREVEADSKINSLVRGICGIEDGTRKPFQPRNMMKIDMDSLIGRNDKGEQEKKDPCPEVDTLDVSPGNEEVQVASEKPNASAEAAMDSIELAPKLLGLQHEASDVKTTVQDFPSSFLSNGAQEEGGNPCKTMEKEEAVTKSDFDSGGTQGFKSPTASFGPCTKSAMPEKFDLTKPSEKENNVEDSVVVKTGKPGHIGVTFPSEIPSGIPPATGILDDGPSGVDKQQTAFHILYKGQHSGVSEITINKRTKPPISGSTGVVQSEKHEVNSLPFSTLFSFLNTAKAGITQPTLAKGKRGLEGIQKPVSVSLHPSNTVKGNELSQTMTPKGFKDLKIVGKMCYVGGSSNEKETNESSLKENDILMKGKAEPCQREMIMKDIGIVRNVKHASRPATKNIAADGKGFSPVGDRKKIAVPCGRRASGISIDPAKYQNQEALKSGQFGESGGALSKNTVLDAAHVPKSQMKTSSGLCLKRKTVEDNLGAISAHPQKRCLQSPPASRSPEEESDKFVNKKTPHISPEEDSIKNKIDDESPFIHQDDKIRGLEITYSIEDSSNINQAEAFGKHLDDICNMLRKKNDEAKDMLAQDIVSNNKLLLLHSPLFELKKISTAQRKLAELSLSSNHNRTFHV